MMPEPCFLHDGWDRYAFRAATAGLLPESVAWRSRKAEPALASAEREAGGSTPGSTGLAGPAQVAARLRAAALES